MKRVLDPSVSPVQKMLKSNQGSSSDDDEDNHDVFPLLDLHNDELKHVLRHLHLDDKKNMKLVAKECEKRVMSIDPDLRKWTVEFTDENYIEQKLGLTKAKLKHMKDGDLHHIELDLVFDTYHRYSFNSMIITESVICEWKNNIFHLAIHVSGYEFYLLCSDINFPNLKSLKLGQKRCEGMVNLFEDDDYTPTAAGQQNIDDIVFAIIKRHKYSLESLTLSDIRSPISEKLNLKNFTTIGGVTTSSIAHVLKCSQHSLETLNLEDVFDDESKELDSINLQVKTIKADEISLRNMASIIKCSFSTLEELSFTPPLHDNSFDLGSNQLKLKKIELTCVQAEFIHELLKLSKESLNHLDIDYPLGNDDLERETIHFPSLKQFSSNAASSKIVSSVIKGSYNTLEYLACYDDVITNGMDHNIEISKLSTNQVKSKGIVKLIRLAQLKPAFSDFTESVLLLLNKYSFE